MPQHRLPRSPRRRPPVPAGLPLALAGMVAAACAAGPGGGSAGPRAGGGVGEAAAPVPAAEPSVAVSPRSGPPGTAVRVGASGFPPGTAVEVGAGPWRSEFEVLERTRTGPGGTLETTVALPEYADPDQRWVFVVQTADHRVDARSEPFRVTAGGESGDTAGAGARRAGVVEVTGTLTDEGVECPAVRGEDGGLYTLAGGDLGAFRPGDRVRVVGTVAEMSFCMQGTTLAVERIEAAP